ncbi:arylesterase [Sphingobacterium corticibacterium]|uniref:Arylesterase n=1 Tax=Sphingobacterium corticibacterium TaxID=2484746 RepID=A0A4Q6XUZ4_9SPHI|nr:arylesterase [Sphingobacterium corticibacterium]RZF61314.1 arylesterase [Sphingobacterium corticibacterium]
MIHILRRYSHLFFGILLLSCNNGTSHTGENKNDQKKEQEASVEQKTIRNILFFGNSLTAGYGLDDPQEAFPALIQAKIDSLGLPYLCINAGLSGETSAGGKERIDWLLQQPVDIFVLELGANDGLRGVSTASTYKNLSDIVEKVRKANPACKLVLAGMKVPPSMGQEYFNEFETLFPRLAKQYDMALVPFLLDNVAGIGNLNQADAVHPTAEGQKILAHNVWAVLEPLL